MNQRFSTLCILTALALCAASPSRAESPAAQTKAVQVAPPQGGGEGLVKAKTASMVIEDDGAAAEAPPPSPAGDERRVIGEYIRDHSGEIKDCYERRLSERKTLQGKLITRFDIGPSGRVIGATADGLGDRELTVCVVKVIRGWVFDKPHSGRKLRVVYPWVFTPTPAQ